MQNSEKEDEQNKPLLSEEKITKLNNTRSLNSLSNKIFRYFCLIPICLVPFGLYFCYVLPGALQKEIERDLRVSENYLQNLESPADALTFIVISYASYHVLNNYYL